MARGLEATLASLQRSAAAEQAREARRAPHPVADWLAPRGPRAADGQWHWTLAQRPHDSFGSDLERRAVRAHAVLVAQLDALRRRRGWSMRHLGQQVASCFPATSMRREASIGLPLSVVTSTLTGTRWGRFDSLALLAQTLGQRVQLAHRAPRASRGPERPDPDLSVVESSWEAYGLLAGAWEVIVVSELGFHITAARTTKHDVALRVGLRTNTVSELWTKTPPERWANVRTLAALAAYFDTHLELVERTEPWGRPQVPTHCKEPRDQMSADGTA